MKLPGLFALLFCFSVFAIEVPYLTGPVVDESGFFSQTERAQIESALYTFRKNNRVQMTVLVPSSLQGLEIEPYAIEVAEKWKLGKKGEDRGLILIIAPKERRLRLEVGYGLEGDIPDAIAKRMIADILTPALKANAPARGVLQLIQYAEARLQKLEGSENLPEYQQRRQGSGLSLLLTILLILLVIFLKAFLFPRYPGGGFGGRGGFGGGGFGGGGFGGFGGGSGGGWSGGGGGFGGGGASGRW